MLPNRRPRACLGLLLLTVALTACKRPAPKPPKPAKVPVTTETLAPGPFQASIGLLGRVVPSSRVEIRAPADGVLVYGPGYSTGLRSGTRVRKGQVLFHIDSPSQRLRLGEARLAEKAARTELERARKGVEAGILPAAELEAREIDAGLAVERRRGAEEELDRLTVRSPIAGVLRVEEIPAGGSEVARGSVLGSLAGDGAPRVEAWVPARELDRLEPGYPVECRRPRDRRLAGVGSLVEISQEVEAGGAARAVAEIADDRSMPRSGEGVELRVLLPESPEALSVPRQAILRSGQSASVFVLQKAGKALKAAVRPVLIGGSDGERVEILDGLEAGEIVAVEGAEYLADGLLAEDVGKGEGR